MFKKCLNMIVRRLSNSKETTDNNPSKLQYLLFPTEYPVSPYYFYSTKINKFLAEYIQKHKIRFAAAYPIRPGVHRKAFYPQSLEDLESELGLSGYNWTEKSSSRTDNMTIAYNNIMYDGILINKEEAPIKLVSSIDQLFPIGTVCNLNITNNTLFLRSEIRLQAEWCGPLDDKPILIGGKTVRAQTLMQVTKQYEELLAIYKKIRQISIINLPDIDISQKAVIKIIELMSGYLCTVAYFSKDKLYQIFKTTSINEKVHLLLMCYRQYLTVLEENWKKQHGNQESIQYRKNQAIFTVYENMKKILGNNNEQKFIDKIKAKLLTKKYPDAIKKLIEAQLLNLQVQGTHDVSRKKHFINLLVDYPFGVLSKEFFDVQKAKDILEEEHYGMDKLKKRVLEFIAVSKLKGQFKSKVLLLYGPPGVGKTSIVKSIAKCLDRPYARISLGGQYDTSIVKGHRKTYVGAYPGKIWDSIAKSKVQNPVILLDQIDKIMQRSGGASLQDCVMQVLDPIQNHKFKDDFMDVQIDLSRVLFICTANSLDTIFPPLLDRLERIQVSGYTTLQKMQIFKRHIVNQAMTENGFSQELQKEVKFSEEATKALIQGYCKEAGVRNMVRKTNKIFQKIALKEVKNITYNKNILPEHLKQYVGLPSFHDARLFPGIPPAGVMIGLAYNNYGGSIMYIECLTQSKMLEKETIKPENVLQSDESSVKKSEKPAMVSGSLMVTGNIHEVMKQSCQLAYTYAKYITSTFFNNNFLQSNDIHLNFPEIQIGKDGPSAGVAITSALISLALNKRAVKEIAMTGEITLAGRVSPIGGVKEKTMGARRQGIKQLIFPQQNRKDVQQLQKEIKQGMTFHFAKHYFQVMQLLFGIKIEKNIELNQIPTVQSEVPKHSPLSL